MRVVVAGSMKYTDELQAIAEELEGLGHQTVLPDTIKLYDGKDATEREQLKLHEKYHEDGLLVYWKPLHTADAILVVNKSKHGIKNYIGGNAFLEMGFAFALGKKVYLLNPMPDMPYYGTEIKAMKPVVINGDLTKIA